MRQPKQKKMAPEKNGENVVMKVDWLTGPFSMQLARNRFSFKGLLLA